ncbi:MAG: enoyl-CoA hydratase/isomerase family protein [Alphaproteobacteria bacterium]|nr:enoyl-CoA hydratase/isomerase family protein [Alphaproteobacteria bacterium]
MSSSEELQITVHGGIATLLLNRPKALNALTLEQIRTIDPTLAEWETDERVKAVVIKGAGDRAFCSGGDVRVTYEAGLAAKSGHGDGALTRAFFREEYRMNRRIHAFPKPYLALLDGITMGGGVGVSVHGSHRIVTERTLFAMPETGIGLFPDVGGSWFLPRCPGELGTYLGLTGARLKAADALYAGVGTHFVPASNLDALEHALAEIDWLSGPALNLIDHVLERFTEPAGPAPLADHQAVIDRCFAADRVEDIIAALEAEGSDFAASTLEALAGKSPTSLKISLAQLRKARGLDFDACMAMEYRISQACMAGHDFFEGIRALLIDRDNVPSWSPATLDEVTDAMVAAHFAPLGDNELVFEQIAAE